MKSRTNTQGSGLAGGGRTRVSFWSPLAVLMALLFGVGLPSARAATTVNHGISAGLLQVIQNGSNANTNVIVNPLMSINDFRPIMGDTWTIITTNIVIGVSTNYVTNSFPVWNTADYYVQIGASKLNNASNGILIASVAQNGRTNASLTNATSMRLGYVMPCVEDNSAGTWRIGTFTTNATGAVEWNCNVSGAFFPYSKYIGGLVRNAVRANGGSNDFMIASPQIVYGTHFIHEGVTNELAAGSWLTGNGRSTLNLTSLGINSMTDGILLVNGGKDENNWGLSKANTDGTWTLYVHDNNTSASSYEQDPIAFVYIARTNTDVVSGKINGDGTIAMYSGSTPQFTVTAGGAGRYTLKMNNYYATNGVLIISAEGGGSYNLDNIVSYQMDADGVGWELQSRDTPANGLQSPYGVVNGVRYTEPAFDFVFIPAPPVGFAVTPTANLITTEAAGFTNSFTVQLNAKPTADVTISGISSSDTTEGIVLGPTTLVFNTTNWYIPQTVQVMGADDALMDGEVAYSFILPAATSADPRFNGLKPSDVGALNIDDEAGITVSANSLVTTESGGTATFTVVLNTAPTDNVTIGLSSSDTTEGTIDKSSLTFTPADWNVAQTVTITGVDDPVVDGNVSYTIVTAPAVSASDTTYNGVNAIDISVSNLDNDIPGLSINPGGTLTVSEPNTATNFSVALSCEPAASVTVTIGSSDTTEGTVSPASRTFTPANWNVPQTFTLTAANDNVNDGTVGYSLNVTVSSTDGGYNGLTATIAAQTLDNEAELLLPSGPLQYAIGWPGLGIDGAATITDPDTFNYGGGSLTVALTANSTSSDRLEIRNTGNDPGQIGTSGATVNYGGMPIGTFSGGVGTSPLVIALNASSSPESAQALARNITYRSVTNTPVLAPRTAVFTLADGAGGTSTASKLIFLSQVHVCDFQQGRDAGFGVYGSAHDCEIYATTPYDQWPSGSDANGLVVQRANASGTNVDREVLLRFDDIIGNNPGQIPAGAVIVQADLLLNFAGSGAGSPLYRMLQPWDDPWTWNTAPGTDGVQTDGTEAEASFNAFFGNDPTAGGGSGLGQMRFSVLTDVQAWVNGTNNYGWVMPAWTNSSKTVFSPSESTNMVDRPRLIVAWLPATASIKSASFRQGVNGYTGAKDTRIREGSPTSTYGTITGVFVDFEVTSPNEDNEQALIRFDDIIGTGAGQVPPNAKIHSAMLDLNSAIGNGPGDGGTINRMLIPWSDTTANWNFFTEGISANDIEAASAATATAGNDSLDPNVTGVTEFDVTSDVQLWANGTANYGWVMLPWAYGGDGWGVATAENSTVILRPQLRVYYSYTSAIMLTPVVNPTNVQVKFAGEIGKTYTVVRRGTASGVGGWTTLGTATVDEGGTATYTDNSPLPTAAFYQVHD